MDTWLKVWRSHVSDSAWKMNPKWNTRFWDLSTRGGGQSHSGGDTYVRVKRPPFSASLAPIDPIFFYSCMSSHPKTHIFAFNLSLKAPWFESWHQTGFQVVLVQCIFLSNTQRPYFFVIFLLSPDDPTYFCIFLSLNAKNHALTQWPLIFWACALTECPACLSSAFTPVSISYLTAPPGLSSAISIYSECPVIPKCVCLYVWADFSIIFDIVSYCLMIYSIFLARSQIPVVGLTGRAPGCPAPLKLPGAAEKQTYIIQRVSIKVHH